MGIKTALVDGPITPKLRTRLESMGFEVVDMNDSEAMRELRSTLETQLVMRKVHDATGFDTIDPNPWPTKKPTCDTSAEINFVIRNYDTPMPKARIEKQDRFSPFDKFVGRGRGSAKNQQFGKYFKHK